MVHYRSASEIAEFVRDQVMTLEEALELYLTEGLLPAVPSRGVAIALEALTAITEGDDERSIVLPDGMPQHLNGWSVVSATEVVDIWHLEKFQALVNDSERIAT